MGSGSIDSIKQYGKSRRDLKSTLEKVFLTKTPADWVLMKERKPKKKKQEKKKKTNCTASDGKVKAILSKSSSSNYAGNFSYYARGDGKGRADKVYNEISPNIGYKENKILLKFFSDYFKISSVNCNFNSKAKLTSGKESGMSKPYAWNAHHLIPCAVFSEMKATTTVAEPIFNEQQYKLLLMSDYNVNNGNNMMALPSNYMGFFQPIHNLIQHPSNHNQYTQRVIKEMKKVAADLEDLTDDLEKPHPDVEVKIAERIKNIENELWDLLVKLGEAAITSTVTDKPMALDKEERSLITQESKSGTQYPMWALDNSS